MSVLEDESSKGFKKNILFSGMNDAKICMNQYHRVIYICILTPTQNHRQSSQQAHMVQDILMDIPETTLGEIQAKLLGQHPTPSWTTSMCQ